MLASLARTCVRHRWIVIGAWVALLIVVNAVAGAVGPDYRTDFTLPDSESKDVQELLEANDPNRAGFTAQIVVKAEQGINDPEVTAELEDLFAFAAAQDGVTVTSPYDNPQQISPRVTSPTPSSTSPTRGSRRSSTSARRSRTTARRTPASRG